MTKRTDYCPVGNEPCQSMCATPCGTRKPLTLLQIQRIACELFSSCGHDDLRMARAIEAAHGIGAQQDGKESGNG